MQEKEILSLGQLVYFALPGLGIVVTAQIVELDNIYSYEGKTVWHYASEGRASIQSDEVDEFGYKKHISFPLEKLKGLQLLNQLPWIDEPVGHAVQLGWGIFTSLNDALKEIDYRSSKKKHRRLRQWRNRSFKFITDTHKMNGYSRPKKPKYPNKKIYTRR